MLHCPSELAICRGYWTGVCPCARPKDGVTICQGPTNATWRSLVVVVDLLPALYDANVGGNVDLTMSLAMSAFVNAQSGINDALEKASCERGS